MPAASKTKAEKKAVKTSGVKELDATFDRIRQAREDARSALKTLRKEYKKDPNTFNFTSPLL